MQFNEGDEPEIVEVIVAKKNIMYRFGHGLSKFFKETFDGSHYPAKSFEDIGKSRFMQLSSVK